MKTISLLILLLLSFPARAAVTDMTPASMNKDPLSFNGDTQDQQIKSFKTYKKEIDQIIQNKMRRHIQQKVFRPDAQGNFINQDIKVDETKDQIIYHIDIPSLHQKLVKVLIRNNAIVLYNDSRKTDKGDLQGFLKRRRYGLYHRVIPLPQNAIQKSIQPTEKNGVLIIRVDKI